MRFTAASSSSITSFNVTAVVDQPVIDRTQQQLMMALKCHQLHSPFSAYHPAAVKNSNVMKLNLTR